MKQLGIAGIAAILLALTSFAQSGIDAEGIATGKTVLWFAGTKVTAVIESDFNVRGLLEIEGQVMPFTALGTVYGEGIGDSSAMTFDLWILIEAVGETEGGEPLWLRGGMAGSSTDADLTGSTFGSATGPFFFLVTVGTEPYRAQGTAQGSAAGTFVVPDDPYTMQIEGTGTYTLIGALVADAVAPDGTAEPSAYLEQLPWPSETWPPDLLARLLALFDNSSIEADEETETSAD